MPVCLLFLASLGNLAGFHKSIKPAFNERGRVGGRILAIDTKTITGSLPKLAALLLAEPNQYFSKLFPMFGQSGVSQIFDHIIDHEDGKLVSIFWKVGFQHVGENLCDEVFGDGQGHVFVGFE